MSDSTIVNGLSVDVEDWFQVGAFENTISREDWDGLELRVGDNVARILDLFDGAGVKATFFTLGWVAERNKAIQLYASLRFEMEKIRFHFNCCTFK